MNSDGSGSRPYLSRTFRLREIFWPSPPPRPAEGEEPKIIPAEGRKAVMTRIDATEVRWTFASLVLATVAGIVVPAYIIAENKVTKHGKNSIAVAPDAWLLGGVLLLFCLFGFILIWKRRRSLLAFDLFLVGFALTLFIQLFGVLYILIGGWLILHAFRINKYGTYNAKVIAQETRNSRARGGASKGTAAAAKTSTKSRATYDPDAPKKPPTASKRYTPKAPPRKKIPKPTQ